MLNRSATAASKPMPARFRNERPLTRPVSMSRGRPSIATCTAASQVERQAESARKAVARPAGDHAQSHPRVEQVAGDFVERAVAAPHHDPIRTRIEGPRTASAASPSSGRSPWPGWSWLQACATGDSPRARARVAAGDRPRDPTRGSRSDLRSFRFAGSAVGARQCMAESGAIVPTACIRLRGVAGTCRES